MVTQPQAGDTQPHDCAQPVDKTDRSRQTDQIKTDQDKTDNNKRQQEKTCFNRMEDPPPYSAASKASVPALIAPYVSPHDYPKLCRVSWEWNTVFQPLLWSQPDRFFSTSERSANSIPHCKVDV